MAGHNKVFGVCENKCFVEVRLKTDTYSKSEVYNKNETYAKSFFEPTIITKSHIQISDDTFDVTDLSGFIVGKTAFIHLMVWKVSESTAPLPNFPIFAFKNIRPKNNTELFIYTPKCDLQTHGKRKLSIEQSGVVSVNGLSLHDVIDTWLIFPIA